MGDCAQTQERVREHWQQCGQMAPIWSCESPPEGEDEDHDAADILLVDCYYQRSPEIQQRVDKISGEMRTQVERGRLKQEEAAEAISQYADSLDGEILSKQREAFWQEWMPKFRVRPGSYLVLLGCNTQLGLYLTFQELFATLHAGLGTDATTLQKLHAWFRRRQLQLEKHVHGNIALKAVAGLRLWKRSLLSRTIGHGSIMGWIYYHHVRSRGKALANQLALRTLYVHHRLVIMRVEGETL
jgi:hypothetical protein